MSDSKESLTRARESCEEMLLPVVEQIELNKRNFWVAAYHHDGPMMETLRAEAHAHLDQFMDVCATRMDILRRLTKV